MEEKKLIMKFDPNTIEHLGVKMYSRIPAAIAELVANAYDAGAKEVTITLEDNDPKRIIVKDNGEGMTFNEINNHFLRIGRNRRTEDGKYSSDRSRIVTGKKGLGKLALFGIGDIIEVDTVKNNARIIFKLDWNVLKNTHEGDYSPEIIKRENYKRKSGTTITLYNLKRESNLDAMDLAVSLSKLLNLFDNDFKVIIRKDDTAIQVDSQLRYSQIESQFDFVFPGYMNKIKSDYEHKSEIKGRILTTEKPLRPGLRGITLFSNGRLINAPEFFGRSESSHFYSYVTGWLDVDFIDNLEDDVISTNRQSLNWDLEVTEKLRKFLQDILSEIQTDWREKRNEKQREEIKEKTEVNIPDWYQKLPKNLLDDIEPMINSIVDKSELPSEEKTEIVQKLHSIIPEYPYYHWRHLHPLIQGASKTDYEKKDYYRAFLEAAKRYINGVRSKSGSENRHDQSMMGEVFGKDNANICCLVVTKKYMRPNGEDFSQVTKGDIEDGQKQLSMGVVTGGRNPVSHEEIEDLRKSGLFSESDCLDALSLLSHLFRRLDDAEQSEEARANNQTSAAPIQ